MSPLCNGKEQLVVGMWDMFSLHLLVPGLVLFSVTTDKLMSSCPFFLQVFLETIHGEENILFWKDVEEFKKLPSAKVGPSSFTFFVLVVCGCQVVTTLHTSTYTSSNPVLAEIDMVSNETIVRCWCHHDHGDHTCCTSKRRLSFRPSGVLADLR